jgi:hypothetical protein
LAFGGGNCFTVGGFPSNLIQVRVCAEEEIGADLGCKKITNEILGDWMMSNPGLVKGFVTIKSN